MTADVHPTAIIADGAEIGEGCSIGAYAWIGPQVRLGAGCKIDPHVVIDGHTILGKECQVASFACLGKRSQDLKDEGGGTMVTIGDRTVLREYVTVHQAAKTGLKTTIGSDCLIQAYCHVAHDCQLGDRVIMSSYAGLSGHVEIGDGAIVGGQAGVVQFVRIGRGAYVGGVSKVAKDILPYAIADGAPAVNRLANKIGMARAGHSPEAVKAVRQAIQTIVGEGLTAEAATEQLGDDAATFPEVAEILEFLRTSKRGIARARNR